MQRSVVIFRQFRYYTFQSKDKVKVLYDGECPICRLEINYLKRREDSKGNRQMEFCDINAKDFESHSHGVSRDDAMKEMTVVDGDGNVHRGVSAFKHMYSAAGLSRLSWFVSHPKLERPMKWLYKQFAHYRLQYAEYRQRKKLSS